jgi:hypothetical protein
MSAPLEGIAESAVTQVLTSVRNYNVVAGSFKAATNGYEATTVSGIQVFIPTAQLVAATNATVLQAELH